MKPIEKPHKTLMNRKFLVYFVKYGDVQRSGDAGHVPEARISLLELLESTPLGNHESAQSV
jgi:hypothetical protein